MSDINHVITLPEVQWLAPQLARLPGAAGLLVTDDGVGLARNELEEIAWMREHTPTLFPWVNSCGDATEWLARAGTPFVLPEQYTDTYGATPTGNGTALARRLAAAQLFGFDVWGSRARRFGLMHWPMIGDVSPGSPGQLNSSSMLRFQAYAAVAFGAKGLFWYSWGQAMWQFEPHPPGPTPIYPVVAEINARLGRGQWSAAILQHDWQAVFATGWWAEQQQQQMRTMQDMGTPSCTPSLPEFALQPHAPVAGRLVEAMSDELLIGVLTNSASRTITAGFVNQSTSPPSTLLVVVDMRVSSGYDAPPARDVIIQLSAAATSPMRPTILPPGTESDTGIEFVAATNSISVSGLRSGDAIGIILHGAAAAAAARELHQWRFDTGRPSLSSVWTQTQHRALSQSTSPFVFASQSRRETPFLLGWLGPVASESTVVQWAGAGVNLLSARSDSLHSSLNTGMRQGVAVIATLQANESTAAGVAAVQARVYCHPNWAGFLLHDGESLDLDDPHASHSTLQQLYRAQEAIRSDSPHAFALVRAGTADEVLRVSQATHLPMVALSLPPVGSGCDSRATCAVQTMRELVRLRDALLTTATTWTNSTSFLVISDPCGLGGDAAARLQAYASLLFGVAGLFHHSDRSMSDATGCVAVVSSINDRAAQWVARLDPSEAQLVAVAGGALDWALPRGVRRLIPGRAGSIVAMLGNPDLLVGVFEPVDATSGRANASLSPPMLMVLDSRLGGAARQTNLSLSPGVLGWTPYLGDCGAGFADCEKLVLGNHVRLALLPGEAMLIGLTCYASCQSAAVPPVLHASARLDSPRVGAERRLWSRRRTPPHSETGGDL